MRQLEARAEDLKAAAGGHEGRARDAATEVAKGNRIIEKLTVSKARRSAPRAVGFTTFPCKILGFKASSSQP